MRSIMIAVSAAIFLMPMSAHASRHESPQAVQQFCGDKYGPCVGMLFTDMREPHRKHVRGERKPRKHIERQHIARRAMPIEVGESPQIVAHPAGCPRTRFCGCGVSVYLLGKAVAQGGLAIASNWLGFPRTAPAPNMAAARHGHVFAIVKVLGDDRVLAYDPNGGRHQTWLHVRSLRGYTVVDPRGANRYASAGS